jgi:hypothetical protein
MINAPAAVPVPSSDLINYRFDQTDKRMDEMNKKLDTIMVQNARFVPEERVQQMIDATMNSALKPIRETLHTYRNWALAIFSSAVVILVAVLGFLMKK